MSNKNEILKEILSWVLTLGLAFAVALLLKRFVIINANVPTGSMENTIIPGDNVLGFRLSYLFDEPERGEVIIFKFPDDESELFIKRVIGCPGDSVRIEDGKIYINDDPVPLDEPYLKEAWTEGNGLYTFSVPENSYFVMGDNRNWSLDSRYWVNPYVTDDEILGKAICVYFPFKHMKGL